MPPSLGAMTGAQTAVHCPLPTSHMSSCQLPDHVAEAWQFAVLEAQTTGFNIDVLVRFIMVSSEEKSSMSVHAYWYQADQWILCRGSGAPESEVSMTVKVINQCSFCRDQV